MSLSLLPLLFFLLANAHPDMIYGLVCPDGTLAISKGLHACCENEPFVYCVLCRKITIGYDMTCTANCNGTVIESKPYCTSCLCKPLETVEKVQEEEEDSNRYHQCPFKRGKKG